MTNKDRNIMGLNGITGFLLATLGLVVTVLFLAYLAYTTQVENATNFYEVKNADEIKMIGSKRADHIVDVK